MVKGKLKADGNEVRIEWKEPKELKAFCDLCTAQVLDGKRHGGFLRREGIDVMIEQFGEMGKVMTHMQFKKKWDSHSGETMHRIVATLVTLLATIIALDIIKLADPTFRIVPSHIQGVYDHNDVEYRHSARGTYGSSEGGYYDGVVNVVSYLDEAEMKEVRNNITTSICASLAATLVQLSLPHSVAASAPSDAASAATLVQQSMPLSAVTHASKLLRQALEKARLIQLQVSRRTVMGGRVVKLGKRVKCVYERTGLSSPASDWVTFLVDFSFELFVGVRPCQFLWLVCNSLLEDTCVS
nr:hypothetical protein CFP56_76912 [Quercus suber]